jgi:hypothetical protein
MRICTLSIISKDIIIRSCATTLCKKINKYGIKYYNTLYEYDSQNYYGIYSNDPHIVDFLICKKTYKLYKYKLYKYNYFKPFSQTSTFASIVALGPQDRYLCALDLLNRRLNDINKSRENHEIHTVNHRHKNNGSGLRGGRNINHKR